MPGANMPSGGASGNNCMTLNESKVKLEDLGIKNVQDLLQHVHRCKLRCVLLQAAQPHDITVWSQGTNDSC